MPQLQLSDIINAFSSGKLFSVDRFDFSPPYRGNYDLQAIIEKYHPKISAVMVLFYEKNGVIELLFIERKKYPGVHSGQISFPGGKTEKEDSSLLQTALRETYEEIGISQYEIQQIGQLTELYIPPSNFIVYPFVGILSTPPSFTINDAEVEKVLSIPVNDLFIKTAKQLTTIESRGAIIQVPAFVYQENVIWGATAIMLREIELILQ